MRRVLLATMAALGAGLLGASDAGAQDPGWWQWALEEVVQARYGDRYDRYDRDDRYDRYDRDDRYRGSDAYREGSVIDIILGRRDDRRVYDRDRRRDRNQGPPFCRNGRGHPVHGWAWCQQKGYGGSDRGRVVWDRRGGWGDIVLRDRSRYGSSGVIDRGGLIDILGDVVFARLVRDARLDRRDAVYGRWLRPYDRTSVLQIRSGSRPLAELSDVDGDGRVDAVLVPRR